MNSQCVLWPGSLGRLGYGRRKVKGKWRLAHRLAYCEANGLSLEDIADKLVIHSCDTPACVNPDHLSLGTHADNMRDVRDRRRRVGARNANSKLTDEQVASVLERYKPRCAVNGGTALAREFNVARSTISMIVTRRNWNDPRPNTRHA